MRPSIRLGDVSCPGCFLDSISLLSVLPEMSSLWHMLLPCDILPHHRSWINRRKSCGWPSSNCEPCCVATSSEFKPSLLRGRRDTQKNPGRYSIPKFPPDITQAVTIAMEERLFLGLPAGCTGSSCPCWGGLGDKAAASVSPTFLKVTFHSCFWKHPLMHTPISPIYPLLCQARLGWCPLLCPCCLKMSVSIAPKNYTSYSREVLLSCSLLNILVTALES